MKRLVVLLLAVTSGAALAQTTGAINPNPAPPQPSVNDDVSPGGCMPIGLTASGEIVFPIQCKEFIERHRGADVAPKPAAVEESKPAAPEEKQPAAVEDKTAARQPEDAKPSEAAKPSEEAAPEIGKPADKPVEAIPLPRRAQREARERAMKPYGCQHYRTYDPVSGTYRTYDGQRRSCR